MGKREEKGGQEEGARGKGWGMVEKGWEGGEKRGKESGKETKRISKKERSEKIGQRRTEERSI